MLARRMKLGALWLAAGTVVFSGCSGPLEPTRSIDSSTAGTSPGSDRGEVVLDAGPKSSGGLFYPLEIGNHWEYAHTFTIRDAPPGGPLGDPHVFRATIEVDLVGTEQRYGREYVVQRETYHEEEFGDTLNEFLYRQDRSGLYNADPEPITAGTRASHARAAERRVSAMLGQRSLVETSSGRAYRKALLEVLEKHERIRHLVTSEMSTRGGMAGTLEGEIAMLRYPLHAHQSWHVREDPLIVYTVEGHESLQLPAGRYSGWRIRIDWPGVFGPDDRAHVWYGRDGQLKLTAHLHADEVDENGNVTGTVVGDEENLLTDVTLVRALAKRRP